MHLSIKNQYDKVRIEKESNNVVHEQETEVQSLWEGGKRVERANADKAGRETEYRAS